MWFRSPGLAIALASVAGTVACAELRSADQVTVVVPRDDDDTPVEPEEDDPTTGVDAGADAAPKMAEDDVSCGRDYWVLAKKRNPACAAREVRIVDPMGHIATNKVSIARTTTGRVGIVWNSETSASSGEMRLATFTPTASGFAAPTIVVRKGSDYDHVGNTTKIAASAPDTFHILTHDVFDADDSGDLRVVRHTGSASTFTNPELVLTNLRSGAETAIAVDGAGATATTIVSARVSTGTNKAKLAVSRQIGTGAFAPLPDLTTALAPQNAPGVGAASLFFEQGQLHLVYHHNELSYSWPRYHTFDGTGFSYRKTLDNNIPEGLSGYDPHLVVRGNTKYAVFFSRKSGQDEALATAELRLATWSSANDTPQITVLEPGFPASSANFPRYRVAMASDPFGLLHIVFVKPDPAPATTGYLEYKRQVRVGGETKWLMDIVDDDVLDAYSTAEIDLFVDDHARPHIAYFSAKDGRVRYATRFDR